MRHVKWSLVVGFVALALGVGAVVQAQQLSGEYKIGVLEPLTGNLAAEGKRHLEGTNSCVTSSTTASAA